MTRREKQELIDRLDVLFLGLRITTSLQETAFLLGEIFRYYCILKEKLMTETLEEDVERLKTKNRIKKYI